MRKVIEYFIRYHVAVNVIIIAFAVFGIVGAKSLNSSFFPLTDSKNVFITITYPGASPQEVEEGIILKIEQGLEGVEGITGWLFNSTFTILNELFDAIVLIS